MATDPRRWGACWSDAEIAEMFEGRKSVEIREALAPESGISEPDRVWLGCRYLAEYDRPALVRFAKRCAAGADAAYAARAARGAAAANAAAYAASYAAAAARAAAHAANAASYAAVAHADAERGAQCAWLLAEVSTPG
jgi:hypothetical protein